MRVTHECTHLVSIGTRSQVRLAAQVGDGAGGAPAPDGRAAPLPLRPGDRVRPLHRRHAHARRLLRGVASTPTARHSTPACHGPPVRHGPPPGFTRAHPPAGPGAEPLSACHLSSTASGEGRAWPDPSLPPLERRLPQAPPPLPLAQAHQLNCVRSKSTKQIVEGDEDDIRAVHYLFALQPTEDWAEPEPEAAEEKTAAAGRWITLPRRCAGGWARCE